MSFLLLLFAVVCVSGERLGDARRLENSTVIMRPAKKNSTKNAAGSCSEARSMKTPSAQCSMARSDDCDNKYAIAYFCASSTNRVFLAFAYAAWLVLLFSLLGSTADEYFSPALEQLSSDFGLPPRFAGVTLLALGNGAPDVSSTMHAVSISRSGYRLALGALTGAGMFVGTVVAGGVMVVGDGAKAKGALLRDVSAYLFACTIIVGVLGVLGTVSYAGVTIFLTSYAAFVLVVLAADLWHRRPGGPAEDTAAAEADEPPAIELLLTLLHSVRRPDYDERGDDPSSATNLDDGSRVVGFERAASGYVVIDGDTAPPPLELGASPFDGEAYAASLLADDVEGSANDKSAQASLVVECWHRCRQHLNRVFFAMPIQYRVLAIPELPFVLARRITVPLTSDDSYARGPLVVSLVGAPLWLCAYASNAGAALDWRALLAAALVGASVAGAVALATRDGRSLEGSPNIALALFGFAVAATWIDVFADELVSALEFFGALAGIPSPVLGLTVLAWGNSIGDFSTNIAMAKRGLANMAMTACFAGPVFNALVGLGIGFSVRLAKERTHRVDAKITTGLYVGFGAIMLNCLAILVVGVANRGYIPKQFGYVSIALYAIYMVVSLAIFFSQDDDGDTN
ncbi:hypothetical protein CTAYLR_010367 [Chrysophaeum taylorii]|uniref:Sodium/calcium exchanger membrane region domain-containing protein n=1 Tax=Chrysophaeum taylorii TaxID=2483200 RepID=A0AAD7UA91_9STRA|nr:hypothetical protein CTAYLR_010367 [Chrysophaeum taylorii]